MRIDQIETQSIHRIKTWPKFFELVALGKKRFEVRFNDREYKMGDIVILREYDPLSQRFSGWEIVADIGVIYYSGDGTLVGSALRDGYCMFAAENIKVVLNREENSGE